MAAMAPSHPKVTSTGLSSRWYGGAVPPIDPRRVDRHRVGEVIGVGNEASPERWSCADGSSHTGEVKI